MRRVLGLIMGAALIGGCAHSQDLAQTDKAARAAHKPISARKIILVGDSTTQVLSGWGGQFCANHLVSSVACINLGRGGRSSFSYRAEGSWQIALNEMQTKNYAKIYVLIQLGHNDMPGKAGRSTDLQTEFPKFMQQYVQDTKKTGAIPILITPLSRRMFKDGILKNDLIPWADAIRKIASQEKIALIDLNQESAKALQEMGALKSLELAQLPPTQDLIDAAIHGTTKDALKTIVATPAPMNCLQAPSTQNCISELPKSNGKPNGKVNLSFDYTHIGENGAKLFSAIVANELAAKVPELSDYIIP
jgi:lysophospholipase L1-like esterase